MTTDLNYELLEVCRTEPRKFHDALWSQDNEQSYAKVKALLNQGADPNVTIRTTAHRRNYAGQNLRGVSLRQLEPRNLYPIIMAALVDNNGAIQALCEDPRLKLARLYEDPEEEIDDSFQACIIKLNPRGLELQINANPRLASAVMDVYEGMKGDLENDMGNIQDILHQLERLPMLPRDEYMEYIKHNYY